MPHCDAGPTQKASRSVVCHLYLGHLLGQVGDVSKRTRGVCGEVRERGCTLKVCRSARTRVRLTLWQTWPRDGKSSFRHNFEHFRASKYVGLAKTASAFSITVLEIISSLTCETQAGSGLKTHIIYQVQNHITWYYCVIGCATRACSRLGQRFIYFWGCGGPSRGRTAAVRRLRCANSLNSCEFVYKFDDTWCSSEP